MLLVYAQVSVLTENTAREESMFSSRRDEKKRDHELQAQNIKAVVMGKRFISWWRFSREYNGKDAALI